MSRNLQIGGGLKHPMVCGWSWGFWLVTLCWLVTCAANPPRIFLTSMGVAGKSESVYEQSEVSSRQLASFFVGAPRILHQFHGFFSVFPGQKYLVFMIHFSRALLKSLMKRRALQVRPVTYWGHNSIISAWNLWACPEKKPLLSWCRSRPGVKDVLMSTRWMVHQLFGSGWPRGFSGRQGDTPAGWFRREHPKRKW